MKQHSILVFTKYFPEWTKKVDEKNINDHKCNITHDLPVYLAEFSSPSQNTFGKL